MLGNHYAAKAQPALAKKSGRISVIGVPVPLKGLSLATKNTSGDPETATILKNVTVEDDRIQVRAGYIKRQTRGTAPIWHMIPHYGTPALAAASNNEVWNAISGALIKGGFTSNDWHWTSFANLGQQKFSVMVNGADGVWSWDGGSLADGAVSSIAAGGVSKATAAVVTLPGTDVANFTATKMVKITGGTGEWAALNGTWPITNINVPVNTITLPTINTAAFATTSNAGIQVTPLGSLVKEPVTAPSTEPWISVNTFNVVIGHQNQLFFADTSNLAIYYLPKLQKSGQVKYLPLNAIFQRGGYIKALATWTTEGGTNMNDQLVIFSSNGEVAIFGGTDPDELETWQLSGVFRFDAPMSKHSVVNYGGELYVLISTGLVPMSTLLKAESDKLGQFDRSIVSVFLHEAVLYRTAPGWMAMLNPSSGRMICNIPLGASNRYRQLVKHMPRSIWQEFADIPSRCWAWVDPYIYVGDDSGNVYEMHPSHQSDDGKAIVIDVQTAWSRYKTPAEKQFKGVHTFMITDGTPRPSIDMKVDFDYGLGVNVPDLVPPVQAGAIWDVAVWDVAVWAVGKSAYNKWNGVAASGVYGAIRMTGAVFNCSFAVTGWNVTFEEGRLAP